MDERDTARRTGKTCGKGLSDLGTISWSAWVVFLVLKCVGVLPATFTWFWVWFPFWLPFAVAGAALVVAIVIIIIASLANNKDR